MINALPGAMQARFCREEKMKTGGVGGWFEIISLLVLLPALAFGSGFGINEQSTKAVGMGGAFVSQADDPSAVYINPAGIVQLEGTQVSAGLSLIYVPDVKFKSNGTSVFGTPGQTTAADPQTFFIPNFYITHKFSDRFSLGLGEFTNFGLKTEWPDDWEGRYITGGTRADIRTVSINPVMAFRPFKPVSLSAGPVLQYLDAELKNKQFLGLGVPDAEVKLKADNWEWGWNVGLLLWLTDKVKFGASYRSAVKHNFTDGALEIIGIPGRGALREGLRADLKLPAILYLGLAVTQGPLTLEFDGQWTEWSSFDRLEADFDTVPRISRPRDWRNAWAYRFGAEYKLNTYLDLRAGIIFDETPIPDQTLDPLLPTGDRWLYTVGTGLHLGHLTVDLAYNFLDDEERTFKNDAGDYNALIAPGLGKVTGKFEDTYAHIFMLNVSYRF